MAGRLRQILLSIAGLLTALVAIAAEAAAPNVVPSPRVQAAVVVRAAPSAASEPLARLRPGEALPLAGEIPNWYRVLLPDGSTGYVSKAWTDVVAEVAPAAPLWRVHFVDVGTGLATFVEGPDFTLVYDGGSNDDKATGAANRFLAYIKKVRADLQVIDHLILSHPHQDHVQLLPDLFDAYQVRNVWDSGRVHEICGYRAFLTKIQAEPGITYHDAHPAGGLHSVALAPDPHCPGPSVPLNVSIPHGAPIVRGLVVELGANAKMTFLHADLTHYPNAVNRNSLPIRLDLGGARLLFMGDAEAGDRDDEPTDAPRANSVEGQVLTCCAAEIKADLLVAGHHGSRTSSRIAFLNAVDAKIFVIASGPFKYGPRVLPDPSIVTELRSRGELWETDFDDAHCRTDTAKIGPDNDQPGGCDNIMVRVPANGPPLVNYERIFD
jgi:competence protein ComEC